MNIFCSIFVYLKISQEKQVCQKHEWKWAEFLFIDNILNVIPNVKNFLSIIHPNFHEVAAGVRAVHPLFCPVMVSLAHWQHLSLANLELCWRCFLDVTSVTRKRKEGSMATLLSWAHRVLSLVRTVCTASCLRTIQHLVCHSFTPARWLFLSSFVQECYLAPE